MGTAAIVKTMAKSVKQSFLLCFHQSFVAQGLGAAQRFGLIPVIHG
jgi:hypothetical protein